MNEVSLEARYLKRARDECGTPYTKAKLVVRGEDDIVDYGPDARTSVKIKGSKGSGLKKHRRLIPTGPLGEVQRAYDGFLTIDFPSRELLDALHVGSKAVNALARYFTSNAVPVYPKDMSLELAVKFAHESLRVELDRDVIEELLQQNPPSILGNGHAVILQLLYVEQKALEKKWKRVELEKWKAADQTWPVIAIERKPMLPPTPRAEGVIYRITERQAKLLRLFDQADEAGKKHMEDAGLYAASQKMALAS